MIRVPNSVIIERVRSGEGSLYVSDVFGRIGASVEKGDLTVKNYSGSIDASVGTGTTDVEVLDVRDKDTVVLSSRAGDIILRLEPGSGAWERVDLAFHSAVAAASHNLVAIHIMEGLKSSFTSTSRPRSSRSVPSARTCSTGSTRTSTKPSERATPTPGNATPS